MGALWWILMCAAFYAGSRWGRARGRLERFTEDALIEETDEFWQQMRDSQ